jgi:hypothetical protein
MKSRLLLLCPLFFAFKTAFPQAPSAANEAAEKGLGDFRQLVSTSPGGKFGLQSTEVEKTELQKPWPVYLVKAEQLAKYASTQDPKELLTDIHSFVYPISVSGAVKSSMQVDQSDGEWRMVAVGRPTFIKDVVSSIDRAGPGTAGEEVKLVQIPALNMYFIGRIKGKNLTLAPIGDNSFLNLKAGKPTDATQVFVRLRDRAQKALQNDVPR